MNLKGYRASKDLSQGKMAELLDLGKTAYRNKEKRITSFKLEEAYKLAEILGISLQEVYDAIHS